MQSYQKHRKIEGGGFQGILHTCLIGTGIQRDKEQTCWTVRLATLVGQCKWHARRVCSRTGALLIANRCFANIVPSALSQGTDFPCSFALCVWIANSKAYTEIFANGLLAAATYEAAALAPSCLRQTLIHTTPSCLIHSALVASTTKLHAESQHGWQQCSMCTCWQHVCYVVWHCYLISFWSRMGCAPCSYCFSPQA